MTEANGALPPRPAPDTQEELYPIREVSRLTGVNPVTLRAWERRYGLIQPTRTDSGHRLYSQADIEAIHSILAWIQRGVAVSKVGSILARAEAASPAADSGEWDAWQVQLRGALGDFDEARLERLYGQVFSTYPLSVVFQDVLLPVWRDLRQRRQAFGRTSEWLFFDAFLRARVLARLQLARHLGERKVLLAAVPEHCQELELLAAGLLLSSDRAAVGVLAIGQPLDELALVCERVRPRALVLYASHALGSEQMRQLERLALSMECPLALAGEASELAEQRLAGTPIACLGSHADAMQRRLGQFLAGRLDT